MPICPWEKTITCPYNPSHQITQERIQTHLVKCRRNHPDMDMAVCPYNASHHIPRAEEAMHVTHCPDRKIIELSKYSWALQKQGQHGNCNMPEPVRMSSRDIAMMMCQDENWETEATIKESYDPQKKCAKTNVLRKIQGATPSERKKFYISERQRHDMIKEVEEENDAVKRKEAEEDTSKDNFYTPRPSIVRPSMMMATGDTLGDLRRPSIEGAAERRSGINPRPGSITSRLLATLKSDTTRRPGSILMNPPSELSVSNTTKDTTDVDTTKDTVDITNTTKDTTFDPDLEARLQKLVLGRGRGLELRNNLQPLRRPSGLGSFVRS